MIIFTIEGSPWAIDVLAFMENSQEMGGSRG